MVVEEASQDPGMVITKGSATGRDRGGHPRKVAGHDVGVALNDDGL